MARVSKTSPFGPRPQPESRSNTQVENKDEEERSSSSSTTSSSDSEKDTPDKKQGKRPMQAEKGKRKPTLYEMMSSPERAKQTVTKRGRGKSMAYTARLWSKYNPRIDVYVSSDEEPNNPDPKPTSTQDKKQEKSKGKRPMQARNGNHKTTLAKGVVNKRGRGKSPAYTLRLWSKHNPRSPPKGVDVHVSPKFEPKVKQEDDVMQSSETDTEELCKRIKIEGHHDDDDDDDTDNDGRGAGTHGNLTSLGIEVVGK